jgi:uncharacterized membrane protein YdbT with pleckstrin-like domain
MSSQTQASSREVWRGRPWILPYVAIRTVLVAAVATVVIFAENILSLLYVPQFGYPVLAWTLIAFFLAWVLGVFNLLLLWSTHSYVLVEDSLEIRVGLFTTKTSMIAPTGFSDLEVIRSITGRVLNTGDILIRTQSERDFTKRMVKVRDPTRVANLIRDVMARPIFKIDERGSDKKD